MHRARQFYLKVHRTSVTCDVMGRRRASIRPRGRGNAEVEVEVNLCNVSKDVTLSHGPFLSGVPSLGIEVEPDPVSFFLSVLAGEGGPFSRQTPPLFSVCARTDLDFASMTQVRVPLGSVMGGIVGELHPHIC